MIAMIAMIIPSYCEFITFSSWHWYPFTIDAYEHFIIVVLAEFSFASWLI